MKLSNPPAEAQFGTAPSDGVPGPLEHETRPTVSTSVAAFYLNRRPQTLRVWACTEVAPIRPIRIHGRLAWSVQDIRRLTSGG